MNALVADIGFYLVSLVAVAAIVVLNSCGPVSNKGYLMSFLALSLLAAVFGQVPFMLMRSGMLEREIYSDYTAYVLPVVTVARVAGWGFLFLFILGLRKPQEAAMTPAGPNVAETNIDNLMRALSMVALLYVIGMTGMLIWLLTQIGGVLRIGYLLPRLALIVVTIALYVMAMRHVSTKKYGKATGFMIAAGILNLPAGIVALVMGVVARRKWKKFEEQQITSATTEHVTAMSTGKGDADRI